MPMRSNLKQIIQMNGVFVMDALHSYREPISLHKIVRYIGRLRSLDPEELREQIESVVENGVKTGFIAKNVYGKFYVPGSMEKVVENEEDENLEDDYILNKNDKSRFYTYSPGGGTDSSVFDLRQRRNRKRVHCTESRSRSKRQSS